MWVFLCIVWHWRAWLQFLLVFTTDCCSFITSCFICVSFEASPGFTGSCCSGVGRRKSLLNRQKSPLLQAPTSQSVVASCSGVANAVKSLSASHCDDLPFQWLLPDVSSFALRILFGTQLVVQNEDGIAATISPTPSTPLTSATSHKFAGDLTSRPITQRWGLSCRRVLCSVTLYNCSSYIFFVWQLLCMHISSEHAAPNAVVALNCPNARCTRKSCTLKAHALIFKVKLRIQSRLFCPTRPSHFVVLSHFSCLWVFACVFQQTDHMKKPALSL